MIPPQSLCQIEIQVGDLERALHFYAETFGWKPVPAEIHQYTVLDVPKDCPFGIALVSQGAEDSLPTKQKSARMALYFAVDDPEDVVRKAESSGGRKLLGPKRVGPYGNIFQIADPDGQRFGLFHRSQNL